MPTISVSITWDQSDELNWLVPDNIAWALGNCCANTKFIVTRIVPDLARAEEALRLIDSYNRIGNDLEMYLSELARWGRGIRADQPQPQDYGLTNV